MIIRHGKKLEKDDEQYPVTVNTRCSLVRPSCNITEPSNLRISVQLS